MSDEIDAHFFTKRDDILEIELKNCKQYYEGVGLFDSYVIKTNINLIDKLDKKNDRNVIKVKVMKPLFMRRVRILIIRKEPSMRHPNRNSLSLNFGKCPCRSNFHDFFNRSLLQFKFEKYKSNCEKDGSLKMLLQLDKSATNLRFDKNQYYASQGVIYGSCADE